MNLRMAEVEESDKDLLISWSESTAETMRIYPQLCWDLTRSATIVHLDILLAMHETIFRHCQVNWSEVINI